MQSIAFDWSSTGVDISDGVTSHRVRDLDALLAELDEPTTFIGEATFESYLRPRRERFLEKVSAAGHKFLVFNPHHTGKYRKAHNIPKTDANDSLVIHSIATEGRIPLAEAKPFDSVWAEFSKGVNREHTIGRFSGQTPELVAIFEAAIGRPESLTDTQKKVFLTGTGEWRPHFVAGIVRASYYSPTRAVFEKLTGMHANGYGCHLRSDIVHWGYGYGSGSRRDKRRIQWKVLRKEVRRAYHILRSADFSLPTLVE